MSRSKPITNARRRRAAVERELRACRGLPRLSELNLAAASSLAAVLQGKLGRQDGLLALAKLAARVGT